MQRLKASSASSAQAADSEVCGKMMRRVWYLTHPTKNTAATSARVTRPRYALEPRAHQGSRLDQQRVSLCHWALATVRGMRVGAREIFRWSAWVLALLFFSCAVASVAERRADGATVFEYLAQGMESVVSDRRADAMAKAKEECAGKEVLIEKEWDSNTNSGFGLQNRRYLLVRCVDPAARAASVVARVRAETGCDQPAIEGLTNLGSSVVFRVSACGARLVCDAVGTDVKCKRALSGEP